jgi:trimethylamine--corrinoid protein Co-methyltransferase
MMPEILDFSSYPQWTAEGEKDVGQRAREKARALLASYQAPALDIAIREELDDFVRRRKADINPNLT